jgi:4-hydroxybenzoyl-CoA thioesterase
MAVVYERAVRFEEVDAAGIAFFARFFNWCHEAMERFFDGIPGGYVGLITKRRIGFPAVHVEADWRAPLRYGDVVRITTSVAKVGTTSATFRYVLERAADGVHVATIDHVTVSTNLDTMTKIPLPADCRALLEQNPAAPAKS